MEAVSHSVYIAYSAEDNIFCLNYGRMYMWKAVRDWVTESPPLLSVFNSTVRQAADDR